MPYTPKRPARHRRMTGLGSAAAAVAISAALGACGSSSTHNTASAGHTTASRSAQTLTIGVSVDVGQTGFDPGAFSGGSNPTFMDAIYNSLFTFTPSGKVEPELVSRYTFNANKTVLTMTLRKGVTFSDGTTLTSALVKENLDRRSDPMLAAYGLFAKGGAAEILNVATPNSATVTIRFAKPEASAPALLADDAGYIVGGKAITDPKTLETTPDGSGPYTLSTSGTIHGSSYALVKNPKAWDASSYPYASVVFKVLPATQTMANALVSGQVQVAQLDPTTLSVVKSSSSDKVTESPGSVYGFALFDKLGTISKPFASVKVRQALAMAVDRKTIASLNTGGAATASLFPSGVPGYDGGLDSTYAYDPTRAKQLLAEAGYPSGFSFTMITSGTTYNVDLQAVQEEWKAIGVTMVIKQAASFAQVFQALSTTPLGYYDVTPGENPLSFVVDNLLGGSINLQHAVDPVIQSAVDAAESGTGDDATSLTKVNDAIVDEGWFIPLYTQPVYYGYDAAEVTAPQEYSGTVSPILSSIRPAG